VQTNSELIRAVLARNDHQAFESLLLRYERLVWTTAWQILRDYHATQDVTQETFLIAHKRLHELREPDAVGVWLCRIARREAIRANQSYNAMQPIDRLEPPAAGPANEVSDEQQATIDAIARLPEHERVVVVLRYLNGHAVTEVAELTGRPLGTVTKQLSRAVKRLRQTLVRQGPSRRVSSGEEGGTHVKQEN
jgi:RNA polymerase sigma-70 factor (ECF subfamily)